MIGKLIDALMEFLALRLLPAVLLILVLFILPAWAAVAGWHAWKHRNDPPPVTFSLQINEWVCSNTKRWSETTMVMSGKVLIPITTHHSECIQWSRKE